MSVTSLTSVPERDRLAPAELEWLGPTRCEGSVVIPAHDEAAVIGRTLRGLADLAADGRLEVVVVCNGCTDDTAALARGFVGVTVLETETASKVAALNVGDTVARSWPRLYLDADVEVDAQSVRELFRVLRPGSQTTAARPAVRYDTTGAPALVRSYYRARSRSSVASRALWGAGAYALSRVGRHAFDRFPDVTADDLFVDAQFSGSAKEVVLSASSVVRTPRDLAGLMAVLRRTYRGNRELATGPHAPVALVSRPASTLRTLLTSTSTPADVVDTLVYVGWSLLARALAARAVGGSDQTWERDSSSRAAGAPPSGQRSAVDAERCDHVLLTRFNLPSRGVESLVRAKEGWLADRVELFERYCAPSVEAQSCRDFSWIVYLDPASPEWLLERLAPYVRRGLFTIVLREEVRREELLADIAAVVGPIRRSALLTTNLDNDDGLAVDFVERLQAVAPAAARCALYLRRGVIRRGDAVYLRTDRHNAFCSVREPWEGAVTCWADWHNRLPLQMPVVQVGGAPGWLQVVHGTNVSNRVHGRRVVPGPLLPLLGPALADLPAPPGTALLKDRWLTGPARVLRELVRSVAKSAVLAAAGPGGLDRGKELLGRLRGAAS